MTMFSYVASVLIERKREILEATKYVENLDYRTMLFKNANEIDLALDLLLRPEDKA